MTHIISSLIILHHRIFAFKSIVDAFTNVRLMVPYPTMVFYCDVIKVITDWDVIRDVDNYIGVTKYRQVWRFYTLLPPRFTLYIYNFFTHFGVHVITGLRTFARSLLWSEALMVVFWLRTCTSHEPNNTLPCVIYTMHWHPLWIL